MSHRKCRSVPAILAGVLVTGGALGCPAAFGQAATAEPSLQELKAQNHALMARIERLESKQDEQAANQAKLERDVVDATVNSVLGDADQRSQFMQSEGFTAGYSNGKFLIQSADGAFVMNPNLQFQARYVANFRNGAQVDGEDESDDGFEVRRMKLTFEGNAFGKDLTYKVQWATSRSGGALSLEEAFVKYRLSGGLMGMDTSSLGDFAIKIGQFKDFTFHEEILSSKRQLAVDRTWLNETLAGGLTDFEQGITLIYESKDGPFRAEFGYIDGYNSDNTNFVDGGGSAVTGMPNAHFGVLGRAEYKLAGNWKQYDDFSAMKNTEDLLVVGGGVNWSQADNGNLYFHTVDVQWEPQAVSGLGVYGAYVGLMQDFTTDGSDDPYHWGFLVQAGYMLNKNWEVFGRYDYTSLDDSAPGTGNTLGGAADVTDAVNEITVGVNYFFHGHASKFTADFTWLPDGSPLNHDGIGILTQGDDEDQFLFRFQYQLLL